MAVGTQRETIYIGRNNSIELILKANNTAQSLSSVTHMEFVISGTTYSSVTAGYFDWQDRGTSSGSTTGWVSLTFGNAPGITPGTYTAELIVYDAGNTNGILWGEIPLRIRG